MILLMMNEMIYDDSVDDVVFDYMLLGIILLLFIDICCILYVGDDQVDDLDYTVVFVNDDGIDMLLIVDDDSVDDVFDIC